ncbi:MAG TPA: hypothetical protein VLB01_01285 [Thermodesulfobacteriota bacterium]|nr:hypothetical protein [Thermodesulfobacteriota bacterium]
MRRLTSQISFILCVLLIAFLTSGGCDIEFSSNNDDDDDDGGNGNGLTLIFGTLTGIDANTDVEGTIVRIEDKDSGAFFDGTVDANGDFEIEGSFSGFPSRLEFQDETNVLIAQTDITVFPGSEIDLGAVTITGSTIDFEDGIFVVLEGNIDEITCIDDDEGSIRVTEDDEDDDEDILVQIDSTTDIIVDEFDDITCNDLFLGDDVEVRGNLDGNQIVAELIEVL